MFKNHCLSVFKSQSITDYKRVVVHRKISFLIHRELCLDMIMLQFEVFHLQEFDRQNINEGIGTINSLHKRKNKITELIL